MHGGEDLCDVIYAWPSLSCIVLTLFFLIHFYSTQKLLRNLRNLRNLNL